MEKDIGNYFYDIAFETEIFDGVYWVPINVLGKTRYSFEEMLQICKLSPENKKNKINNLYEAIQLYQISEFRGVIDNKDFWINGVHWQTHKTAEEAVFSNEGCCATDTNWLAYFICDKYDKVGSFCYGNTDGNGHITTYIKQDGDYYFIDMMMCRKDSQNYFCKESGCIDHLMNTEWAGFLYKTKNPHAFCQFTIERFRAKNRDVPYCFYMRDSCFVSATGEEKTENEITLYVPACDRPSMIYKDSMANHRFAVVELPEALQQKKG